MSLTSEQPLRPSALLRAEVGIRDDCYPLPIFLVKIHSGLRTCRFKARRNLGSRKEIVIPAAPVGLPNQTVGYGLDLAI